MFSTMNEQALSREKLLWVQVPLRRSLALRAAAATVVVQARWASATPALRPLRTTCSHRYKSAGV